MGDIAPLNPLPLSWFPRISIDADLVVFLQLYMKTFMAQSSMMDSCTHITFEDSSEAIVKRMKKEPGGVTGKSVVVLKGSDVTTRNEIVFMPNTIEMAQLKKPDKGQFKTNVQISSKMTEMDIKKILEETFPFLGHQRYL